MSDMAWSQALMLFLACTVGGCNACTDPVGVKPFFPSADISNKMSVILLLRAGLFVVLPLSTLLPVLGDLVLALPFLATSDKSTDVNGRVLQIDLCVDMADTAR